MTEQDIRIINGAVDFLVECRIRMQTAFPCLRDLFMYRQLHGERLMLEVTKA